jgi:hypothetical protein
MKTIVNYKAIHQRLTLTGRSDFLLQIRRFKALFLILHTEGWHILIDFYNVTPFF